VGEEYGVETLQADAERLLTKVRSGIDHDLLAVARKEHGGPEAIVARIGRSADAAMAA